MSSRVSTFDKLLGQKSCRTKVPRIFPIFIPNFAPNFSRNSPRIFCGVFVLRFVGNGDQKIFYQKKPPVSNANPQANLMKKSTKVFWRVAPHNKLSLCFFPAIPGRSKFTSPIHLMRQKEGLQGYSPFSSQGKVKYQGHVSFRGRTFPSEG